MIKLKNILKEWADMVVYQRNRLNHSDDDAIPFAQSNSGTEEMRLGIPSTTHHSSHMESYDEFAGRLWYKSKILAFWNYPKSTGELDKIIESLNTQLIKYDAKIDSSWKIEIPLVDINLLKPMGQRNISYEYGKDTDLFVPIDEYDPSVLINPLGYAWEKARDKAIQQHTKSPMFKQQMPVPKGLGSQKMIAGLPPSLYKSQSLGGDGRISLKSLIEVKNLKTGLEVRPIDETEEDAFRAHIEKHYIGKDAKNISQRFGIFFNNEMIGIIAYGPPQASLYAFVGLGSGELMELRRLFIADVANIHNPESQAISLGNEELKTILPNAKAILTFADPSQGHIGTIYQATNSLYLGIGKGQFAKHRYLYLLGDKREKRDTLRRIRVKQQEYPKKDVPIQI